MDKQPVELKIPSPTTSNAVAVTTNTSPMTRSQSEEKPTKEKKRLRSRSTASSMDSVQVLIVDTERNPPNPEYQLDMDQYFMTLAFLTSMRSKDPDCQTGACIVNQENKVISMSFNELPQACTMESLGYTGKQARYKEKELYLCHAPLTAIIQSRQILTNTKIYITDFPCHECAKYIVLSGITCVCYCHDDDDTQLTIDRAKRMFYAAGVRCTKILVNKEFVIKYNTTGRARRKHTRLTFATSKQMSHENVDLNH